MGAIEGCRGWFFINICTLISRGQGLLLLGVEGCGRMSLTIFLKFAIFDTVVMKLGDLVSFHASLLISFGFLNEYPPQAGAGGVRTGIARHCGCRIFKVAAKVEKNPRLYALYFDRHCSFLRTLSTVT